MLCAEAATEAPTAQTIVISLLQLQKEKALAKDAIDGEGGFWGIKRCIKEAGYAE